MIEAPVAAHGVYVGQNRVLIRTSDGFPLYARADDERLTPKLVQEGWSDQALLGFLDEVLRGGDWFVDFGADIGLFSLAAAQRVGRWGRVLADEADRVLAEVFALNVRMNGARNVSLTSREEDDSVAQNEDRDAAIDQVRVESTNHPESDPTNPSSVVNAAERLADQVPRGAPIRALRIRCDGNELDLGEGIVAILERSRVDFIVLDMHGFADSTAMAVSDGRP